MPKINFRIDGIMILVLLVAAALVWIWTQRKDVISAINPADSNNLVNRGVTAVVGEENIASAADYVFGAIDLLNPWNESDTYARQVYGLGETLPGAPGDESFISYPGGSASDYAPAVISPWSKLQ